MTEDAPVAVSEEPKAELTEEEKLKKRAEKFGATDAVVGTLGAMILQWGGVQPQKTQK